MKNGLTNLGLIVLSIALVLAGWFVGNGFYQGRIGDRYVTVKGLAERDVEADIGLWPIRFVTGDNNLGTAQYKIEQSKRAIMFFLKKHGIDSASVALQDMSVVDMEAERYRGGQPGNRFIINQTLMVRTNDPTLILNASQDVGKLVEAGVVLSTGDGYGSGPTYVFTRLNDLKPEMIADATGNARQAGEQFAKDSGSKLGKIRRAFQGTFEILPRDRAPGIMENIQLGKTVRVVSTIEYYLKD
jgi:hypothetical protein